MLRMPLPINTAKEKKKSGNPEVKTDIFSHKLIDAHVISMILTAISKTVSSYQELFVLIKSYIHDKISQVDQISISGENVPSNRITQYN